MENVECLELYIIDICYIQRIYFAGIFTQNFSDFGFFKIGSMVNISVKMPQKKRTKRRGSQEMERMSTQIQAKSPKLTCVPENQQSQQAAGAEEVVVEVEDPLEMPDTEQGDIALETQQDLDSSDKDIADTQDTHAAGGHRRARAKARGHACNVSTTAANATPTTHTTRQPVLHQHTEHITRCQLWGHLHVSVPAS